MTHRHPAFWPERERFDPDRFAPEHEAGRRRHAYVPFGAGPRACIGRYFSMLEAVIAPAVLAQAYTVTAADVRIPLAPRITLHPAAAVPRTIAPR